MQLPLRVFSAAPRSAARKTMMMMMRERERERERALLGTTVVGSRAAPAARTPHHHALSCFPANGGVASSMMTLQSRFRRLVPRTPHPFISPPPLLYSEGIPRVELRTKFFFGSSPKKTKNPLEHCARSPFVTVSFVAPLVGHGWLIKNPDRHLWSNENLDEREPRRL